jgi:hypothetical protein
MGYTCRECGSISGHTYRYVPRYIRRPEYDAPKPGSLEPPPRPTTIWWETTANGHEIIFDLDPYVNGHAKCYVDGFEREYSNVRRYRDGGTTRLDIDGIGTVTRPSPLRSKHDPR